MGRSLFTFHDVEVVASDLDHPECVNFGPDGYGYAGGEAGQLFRFSMDGNKQTIANTGGGIGGICVDGKNYIYECNYGKPYVHRISPAGEVTVYSSGTEEESAVYPNYPVLDRKGNLFYSDSGDYYQPSGRLYVVRPDGRTEKIFGDHLHFPNGLAIDIEEKWLYVIQSSVSNILRFPLMNGKVGDPEIYVDLPGTVPDGLAFAASGNLYVACYSPDAILRVKPNRTVEMVISDNGVDKVNRPTNVAFVPGSTELCFANFGGYSVNKIDVGEQGQPLFYPKLR